MGNKLETAPEETISEGKCCHYWIIEMPQGPTCRGIFHFCGGKKETDSFGPNCKPPTATIYNRISPGDTAQQSLDIRTMSVLQYPIFDLTEYGKFIVSASASRHPMQAS